MGMILFDIDTQKDFMHKTGSLYVEGAETIIPTISKIMHIAKKHDVVVVGTVDAHDVNDSEFEVYPSHCVVGTIGYDKIPETIIHGDSYSYIVANTGNGIDLKIATDCWQIYFEKQTYDIWDKEKGQPDNLQTFLRDEDVTDVYVIGVASNICVLAAVVGFIERGYRVHVIQDAIKGLYIDETNNECTALFKMKELGVNFVSVSDFEKASFSK